MSFQDFVRQAKTKAQAEAAKSTAGVRTYVESFTTSRISMALSLLLFGVLRRSVFGPVVGGLHQIVKFLNTGRWETADPLTSFAQAIQSRTRVQNLPGSFVFQVGVTWNDPNVAARIASITRARQIMTSQAVIDALPEQLKDKIRPISRTALRGKQDALHVFEILWEHENSFMGRIGDAVFRKHKEDSEDLHIAKPASALPAEQKTASAPETVK